MLPANPRLGSGVVVVVQGKGELVLSVIATSEVAQNGIALKDAQAVIVVVNQGGDAAIGVHGDEPRLLLDVLADVNGLPSVLQAVRVLELLEQDRGLVAVGRACAAQSAC